MSDATESPTGGAPEGEPVAQLAALREDPSPRLLAHVLEGINQRQTTARAIEMSWWGFTALVMELVDTMFRALGLRESSDGDPR